MTSFLLASHATLVQIQYPIMRVKFILKFLFNGLLSSIVANHHLSFLRRAHIEHKCTEHKKYSKNWWWFWVEVLLYLLPRRNPNRTFNEQSLNKLNYNPWPSPRVRESLPSPPSRFAWLSSDQTISHGKEQYELCERMRERFVGVRLAFRAWVL